MHWHVHHDGAANFREADGRLEVAVALGTDPAVTYAATAPLPAGIDEFMFAGFLRGRPVELAACATVDLEVPADAEIVLEGYVDKAETRREGPFGDHTGYYSLADDYPVFHLTAMSMRRDAVYPATIVGRPPMEDCFLGKATERLFLPLLRLTLPEIVDLELPIEGVFHDCAVVSIRKAYPGHARKVMSAVWGMGQMMFTKFVVVVDEHVDVHDPREVAWRVFNNVDPRRDTMIVDGPLDVLDHSSPTAGYGAKMGIDATKAWPDEGHAARVARRARHGPGRQGARRRALVRARPALHVGARDRRRHIAPGVAVRSALFARLIKVEHSVYALPFAYAGAVLAQQRIPSWQTLVWITVAMVAARSAAMALNRLIDAGIDARNPRTAQRELPAGRLSRAEVVAFTAASLGVLVLSTFFLSPPCRYLWPIVVAAFIVYPYTKRFTWFCHYALGLTDGLAPAAAWVAVSGSLALSPVLLFLAVGLWVGGFDVIYAIFDLDFDRREGIHSIPVTPRLAARAAGRRAAPTWPRSSCSSRSAPCSGWACPTRPAACWSPACSPGRTSTSPGAAWPASAWGS